MKWLKSFREHLKEDGRIDPEKAPDCLPKGVVHLSGGSSSRRSIRLCSIVTDVLRPKEAVDRIQVEELLWERESRTKEKPPEVLPPGQEPAGSERDVVESNEEGKVL